MKFISNHQRVALARVFAEARLERSDSSSTSFFCFVLNRNKNSIVGFKIGDRTKRTYKKLFEEINNKYTVNYVCTDKLKTYTSYRYESDKNTINDRYIPNNKQLSENLIKKYKSDKDNELKQFSIHIRSKTEIQSPSYASLLAITNLLLGEV